MDRVTCLACIVALAVSHSWSQDERLRITAVTPLYCFDLVEGSDRHVMKIYNYECVDQLRLTFENSDLMRVSNVTFFITVSETRGASPRTIYKGKHKVHIQLLPEEVSTFELHLPNPIAPPDGERDFNDRTKWQWSAEVLSINSAR